MGENEKAIKYIKEGKIAIFIINRPDQRNAMNIQANREMHEAMVDFRDDDNLWVGIVTGAGDKAFCSGADIKETLPFMKTNRNKPWAMPPSIRRGFELWKPLIAAVNGIATGGGLEMALACDIRIAAEGARFGTTEVKVGLIPGGGGTQRLPRTISLCRAAEMLFMGRIIDAQEAYRIGLINKIVPQAELMETAKAWANEICQNAPLAVRAAKKAMYQGLSMTLEQGLVMENSLAAEMTGTADFDEGIKAFTDKRRPNYKGK
jgi:enoyl-CoA hydratase/carnithine racemase